MPSWSIRCRSRREDSASSDEVDAPLWFPKAAASVGLAMALLIFPLEANAGFGPSGGATNSVTPGISSVNVNDLSGKKLEQLIGSSLDENRLNDFQSQLDSLIESIVSGFRNDESVSQSPLEQAPTQVEKLVLAPVEQQRLDKARQFQAQILERERLLDKLEAQPLWFNYFAAFTGSVFSTLIMHPVDTVKTRIQSKGDDVEDDGKSGTFENLYEGLGGNILKEGPPSSLYLGVYETVKSSLLHGRLSASFAGLFGVENAVTSNLTYLLSIYLISGAAGEMIGSTIRAPAEAIKSLVQTQSADSAMDAAKTVFGDGRENVFRAWSASLWRDVPFGASQLAIFELTKVYILNNPNIDFDSSTLLSEALIGAFAGACGSFLTNPTDVITTRIITQSGQENFISMGRIIWDEGGIWAFFKGWPARVLYWAPAISLFLTCYCTVRQTGVKLDLFGG